MRGGTGTVGGKFYADELQTAIFLFFVVMAGMSGREKCVDEKETVEG